MHDAPWKCLIAFIAGAVVHAASLPQIGPICVCSAHLLNGRHAPSSVTAQADVEAIFANHRRYAARHNYTYIVQTAPFHYNDGHEVGVYWTKVYFLRTLLRPPYICEWLFWIDSDAAFINLNQPIERLLRDPANNIALAPHLVATGTKKRLGHQRNDYLASLLGWLNPRLRPRDSSSIDSNSSNSSAAVSAAPAAADADANATWYPATSLVFSGDTNAINAGVLLLRRTEYARHLVDEVIAIGAKLRRANVTVGMGSDNAAFAIFLGGTSGDNDQCRLIRWVFRDIQRAWTEI